jgi:hypothetical protein
MMKPRHWQRERERESLRAETPLTLQRPEIGVTVRVRDSEFWWCRGHAWQRLHCWTAAAAAGPGLSEDQARPPSSLLLYPTHGWQEARAAAASKSAPAHRVPTLRCPSCRWLAACQPGTQAGTGGGISTLTDPLTVSRGRSLELARRSRIKFEND